MIACLSVILIFGAFGSHFLVFLTSKRSTSSHDDNELFEVLARYFTYEDNEIVKEAYTCFNVSNDHPHQQSRHHDYDINDDNHHCYIHDDYNDDGCKCASEGVDHTENNSVDIKEDVKDVIDNNKDCLTQRAIDDLKRRSEEFIEREKQRLRDEKKRDRDEMKNKKI
ncbi:hypothetical protein QVD17_28244 [Tagetes erecta]|uniref:Uncharacterized protein n=1 Tax=Tagetes erecta TaxID=13708 RepID=A0AAD8NS15_TARER|nr:hypothetical protein QVD17_28244 [Tagetes erecta]